MTWVILLLLHLVGLVGYSLLLRRAAVASRLHPWVLATLLQTGIMLPMLVAAPFLPIDLNRIDSASAGVMGVVVALGIFLLFGITRALHYLEASTFSIIYSLRIIIVTLLAAALLAEVPSGLQVLGGLFILAATCIVRQKGSKKITRRGMIWGIAMAVTISILGVAEKYVINEVGIYTAAPIVTLIMGVIMWSVVIIKRHPVPKKQIMTKTILWLMVMRSLSNWGFVFALAAGALVSVATFVSSLSVVAIVGLGALLLGERDYLRRKIIAMLLAAIGLVSVLFGNGVWPLVHPPQSDQKAIVVTYSTDTPSEIKPGDTYRWQGSGNDPKKIIIPGIGVDAYIQNVGVDQRKEIAVPNNIHLGGWFVDSVRPGGKGLSIIDGHLNGTHDDGIFVNLDKLKPGDTYVIEFGDGSKKYFRIKSNQTVALDQAASVLFSQDPTITNQLTLITCGGAYDSDTRIYDKRVIVVSELQQRSESV